jgi:hypothetical protein
MKNPSFFQNFIDYIIGSVWVGTILQLKELPLNSSYDYASSCGALNCPNTPLQEATSKPTLRSVYILSGTIVGATVLAILITILLVDDLDFDEEMNEVKRGKITLSAISRIYYSI